MVDSTMAKMVFASIHAVPAMRQNRGLKEFCCDMKPQASIERLKELVAQAIGHGCP
jgi:hypothetical protein